LIILLTFSEEYKLWSSSLCSFLEPFASVCLLGTNILLSTLLSKTKYKIRLTVFSIKRFSLHLHLGYCSFAATPAIRIQVHTDKQFQGPVNYTRWLTGHL
jgi:hypothetical protein